MKTKHIFIGKRCNYSASCRQEGRINTKKHEKRTVPEDSPFFSERNILKIFRNIGTAVVFVDFFQQLQILRVNGKVENI